MAYRKLTVAFIFTLLLIAGAIITHTFSTSRAEAQTIPTRTPTPDAENPTATSEPDDPGDPGPNPTSPPATSTSGPPQATATSTPIPLPPTPEDGFLPTVTACDPQPVLRSLGSGVNVRSGPGLDYEVVGSLQLQEVRPIVGRAADVSWWQTVLTDGVVAWVADNVVEVSGYIGHVEIVPAPPLEDGATVTPGTPWAPTPRPECTPPPTETSTPSPTPSATATATASLTPEPSETAVEEEMPETEAAAESETATPIVAVATAEIADLPATPTAEPLPEEVEGSANTPWIPIAAIGLILIAAGLFVVQRLRG
ncbi:MAG: SH3 domain-containing protein [Chloroflexota bacterium]